LRTIEGRHDPLINRLTLWKGKRERKVAAFFIHVPDLPYVDGSGDGLRGALRRGRWPDAIGRKRDLSDKACADPAATFAHIAAFTGTGAAGGGPARTFIVNHPSPRGRAGLDHASARR